MWELCAHVDDHLSLSVLSLVGEAHLLPHQTGEHWTLMVTPLQARLQDVSINAGVIEGVERRSSWLLQDMPIFKSTDPGAEVMYTLWCFNVDAFLEQYDEASMGPHIFTSLHG